MTTVELPCSPLPRRPALDEGWSKYINAYDIILDAERHADEQVDTLDREGKVHLMSVIELFNRCGVLESEEPCSTLAREVESSSQTGGTVYDVVFMVGKRYYDYFLRTRAFGFFPTTFAILVSSQIGHPPGSTQPRPYTLRVPPSIRCGRDRNQNREVL